MEAEVSFTYPMLKVLIELVSPAAHYPTWDVDREWFGGSVGQAEAGGPSLRLQLTAMFRYAERNPGQKEYAATFTSPELFLMDGCLSNQLGETNSLSGVPLGTSVREIQRRIWDALHFIHGQDLDAPYVPSDFLHVDIPDEERQRQAGFLADLDKKLG